MVGAQLCQYIRTIKLNNLNERIVGYVDYISNLFIETLLARDVSRHFSKEEIQMANKHKRKWLTALAIKGMKIKTAMRYR